MVSVPKILRSLVSGCKLEQFERRIDTLFVVEFDVRRPDERIFSSTVPVVHLGGLSVTLSVLIRYAPSARWRYWIDSAGRICGLDKFAAQLFISGFAL
jgi:hypothetical protein